MKHFEPNQLFEVPETGQTPKSAQETSSQKPVLRTEGTSANQDPWDTQMEAPFSEKIVEPVFKRPEMTDFEIPTVLEEMIPDTALIHKHLPRQADIDRIMIQINRKYMKRMHLHCNLKDMQATYMQSPHFCDIYVVPPQSWGDRSDTKHSKCLLLGGRRLNQLTLIPKPKGSGSARAATAQVGPANNRNDTKRCLPIEASLRPGEAVPW